MQKEEKLRRENQAKLKFLGYFGKISKPTNKMVRFKMEGMISPFNLLSLFCRLMFPMRLF